MKLVVWIWIGVGVGVGGKGDFNLCEQLKREMDMRKQGTRKRWVRLRSFLKENVEVMCL